MVQEFPFSTPVYLQEKMELQQTISGGHLEYDEGIINSLDYEVEYGLAEWLQVSAGYTFEHDKNKITPLNSRGFEAGALLGFFNTPKHAAALSLEAEFPLKNPKATEFEVEDSPSFSPTAIYAFQFYKSQIHLNTGAEFQGKEVNWFHNAAAVFGNGEFHPVVELNAVSEEEFEWFAGAGLILSKETGWELGAGIRRGINNSEWNAVFHLVYEFSLGDDED